MPIWRATSEERSPRRRRIPFRICDRSAWRSVSGGGERAFIERRYDNLCLLKSTYTIETRVPAKPRGSSSTSESRQHASFARGGARRRSLTPPARRADWLRLVQDSAHEPGGPYVRA